MKIFFMKINFISLGCDKNLVDSEMMLGAIAEDNGTEYIFTDDGKIVDSVPNYGGLKIKEARTIDGAENYSCIVDINSVDRTKMKVDGADNSVYIKEYEENEYCMISCKEDWNITTSAFENFVGVNAVAAGAGVNLMLACDFIYASDKARFMEAFAKVGLISSTFISSR